MSLYHLQEAWLFGKTQAEIQLNTNMGNNQSPKHTYDVCSALSIWSKRLGTQDLKKTHTLLKPEAMWLCETTQDGYALAIISRPLFEI